MKIIHVFCFVLVFGIVLFASDYIYSADSYGQMITRPYSNTSNDRIIPSIIKGKIINANTGIVFSNTPFTLTIKCVNAVYNKTYTGQTNQNGEYSAKFYVTPTQSFTVEVPGYMPAVYPLEAKAATVYTIDFYLYDNTPPTGTISINSNNSYTKTTAVTLSLNSQDTGTGINRMKFSNDNVTCIRKGDSAL